MRDEEILNKLIGKTIKNVKYFEDYDSSQLTIDFKDDSSCIIDTMYNDSKIYIELNKSLTELDSFMDAIEKYRNGNTIVCKIHDETHTYDITDMKMGQIISKEDGYSVSPEEIIEGTWYIKNEREEV